ncbi:uroporphyrinogen-III synthase [Pseudomonas sp. R2.Fl]|nr:uroporphyrinogen-III synthase [Pseudomonas sp. R2.Fl]
MRVLVTRPEPAATRTAERLRALGHEPVVMPLSVARRFPQRATEALEADLSGIVVTSAEAIRTLAEIDSAERAWTRLPLFAVGEATAAAARDAGFETVVTGAGDGASLARLIEERSDMWSGANRPLLYLTGTPRSLSLETALEQTSVPFRICECYRMEFSHPSRDTQARALTDPIPDAVLHYSTESLRRFLGLSLIEERPDLLTQIVPVCMSATVAEHLPPAIRNRARIAPQPTEDSLLSLL